MSSVDLYMAPLQGFTDVVFRYWHSEIYGALDGYFTPFVRVEKGVPRERDLRDCSSLLNANLGAVPQIIFKDIAEFEILVNAVRELGFNRVDLNMGCPFVPQVRKGRGAGVPGNTELLSKVAEMVNGMPDMVFSAKMRLGVSNADEWRNIIPIINGMELCHVTMHPRTAMQQYGGDVNMDEFVRFAGECRHKVVFNGDIVAPEQISDIVKKFPGVAGVMMGRGLIMRPSLAKEYAEGCAWDRCKRVDMLMKLHSALLNHAESNLCGEHQVLGKLLPYWEYFGREFDKKGVKRVIKANSLARYKAAVLALE